MRASNSRRWTSRVMPMKQAMPAMPPMPIAIHCLKRVRDAERSRTPRSASAGRRSGRRRSPGCRRGTGSSPTSAAGGAAAGSSRSARCTARGRSAPGCRAGTPSGRDKDTSRRRCSVHRVAHEARSVTCDARRRRPAPAAARRGLSRCRPSLQLGAAPGPNVTGFVLPGGVERREIGRGRHRARPARRDRRGVGLTAVSAISARNTASYGDLRLPQPFRERRREYAPAAPAARGASASGSIDRDIRGTLAENPATRSALMASPCCSYCVFRSTIAWPRSRLSPCTCSNRCSDNERVRSNRST